MSTEAVGKTLLNPQAPLKDRFRALFTLRNLGSNEAVDVIACCFNDPSALLKHELAFCLGQMQNSHAIPKLVEVLKDCNQETMVRHEAGEALGAIGDPSVKDILRLYSNDSVIEVAETCQLALRRLEWISEESKNDQDLPSNPFNSVDPTPPAKVGKVEDLKNILMDENLTLFDRYRAMFTLRNMATKESVLALAEGLKGKSALFRHEIAYVLGQIQHDACVEHLAKNLQDINESPMVRHECAEALGAIANPEATKILHNYLKDQERVVRESCVVALDISEYENSTNFQYADTMVKLTNGNHVEESKAS